MCLSVSIRGGKRESESKRETEREREESMKGAPVRRHTLFIIFFQMAMMDRDQVKG